MNYFSHSIFNLRMNLTYHCLMASDRSMDCLAGAWIVLSSIKPMAAVYKAYNRVKSLSKLDISFNVSVKAYYAI